ncbi:MAG: hypothetical protein DMG78_27395 [Acidobacteria bacterium]|nr:MAG: hypothetical protein DMG78_27395 [Acidobacteriota bacterium]
MPIGPSAGICDLCATRDCWRTGLSGLHETSVGHAGTFSSLPAGNTLASTSSGWTGSRPHGIGRAAGLRRGLWLCRRCLEWNDGAKTDACFGCAEASSCRQELCLRQCGRYFRPSLFIGAMLGGAVGTGAHHLSPAYTATPGAYALVGMGAVFAGIVRAPIIDDAELGCWTFTEITLPQYFPRLGGRSHKGFRSTPRRQLGHPQQREQAAERNPG